MRTLSRTPYTPILGMVTDLPKHPAAMGERAGGQAEGCWRVLPHGRLSFSENDFTVLSHVHSLEVSARLSCGLQKFRKAPWEYIPPCPAAKKLLFWTTSTSFICRAAPQGEFGPPQAQDVQVAVEGTCGILNAIPRLTSHGPLECYYPLNSFSRLGLSTSRLEECSPVSNP